MRRRLQKFLPVVLIALAIQVLAPIVACWATALVVSNPLGAVEICHSGGSVSGQTDQGRGADHHGGCPICCVLQANLSLEAPRPVTLARPPHLNLGVLTGYETPLSSKARAGSNSQARAPPRAI